MADRTIPRRDLLKAGASAATATLLAMPFAILPKEAEAAIDLPSADPFLEQCDGALEALDNLYNAYVHWTEVEISCDDAAPKAPASDPEQGFDRGQFDEWLDRRRRVTRELGYGAAYDAWRAAVDVCLDECAAIREVPTMTLAGAVAKARLANADLKMLPFLLQDLQKMEEREREARAHG